MTHVDEGPLSPTISALEQPLKLGTLEVPNRVFMAPCTRHRADVDQVPTAVMGTYYAQRASAGLIISEGVNPSPLGRGYYNVPGLYTDEHERGWVPVVDAVHEAGGRIFAQLMHVGRVTFPEMLPGAVAPVAPSAVRPDPEFRGYPVRCPRHGRPFPTPAPLDATGVKREIRRFGEATARALRAGFDGIEIHAASGYLPMQFLSSHTNRREDSYGGPASNRVRFLLECLAAAAEVAGPDRVAVKLSPGFNFNDVRDEDTRGLYAHLAERLGEMGLAFVEVSDYRGSHSEVPSVDPIGLVRAHYPGTLVANGGFDRASAEEILRAGGADAVSFGTSFIANPDLPARFRNGGALNEPDRSTLYVTPDADLATGYTDYPAAYLQHSLA